MDVVVTGAAGRIGSAAVDLLLRQGHAVRSLDVVGGAELDRQAALGASVVVGGLEPALLADVCAGADAVVHSGAVLVSHGRDHEAILQPNFMGTYRLLSAVREHAPALRRFVLLSSDAVYWPTPAHREHTEATTEDHPRRAGTIYGATKVGAEQLCHAFRHSYGVPTAVARPTSTAVARELVDPTSMFGRRWFVGGARSWWARTGLTESARSTAAYLDEAGAADEDLFVVVDAEGRSATAMIADARDVAAGVVKMLDDEAATGAVVNLGSVPYVEADLVDHLAARLGRTVHRVPAPSVASWHLSNERSASLFGYQPRWDIVAMVDDALR